MSKIATLVKSLQNGDEKALARCISIVENDLAGAPELLSSLDLSASPQVIGLTGPPGAGKSTLLNGLLREFKDKKIGLIAVDPSSPFNFGALLGDRIRMGEHFNNPNIFIRSLASRRSMGGLSNKILEVLDVMRAYGFDHIFVETVGVGQSEVEIAGLADTTAVVLVPDAGDEVQTMKAGLMEIADLFIVNKSDRKGADTFVKNLQHLTHGSNNSDWEIPVLKTVATEDKGYPEVLEQLEKHKTVSHNPFRKAVLLTEKAMQLITSRRMTDVDEKVLHTKILESLEKGSVNIYNFVENELVS